MIKYLGSKRLLLPHILAAVDSLPPIAIAADLFSGTCRVAVALKARGCHVTANDHNAYAATLARCYVQADGERVREQAERLLPELQDLPGRDGWFTELYCRRARYFQPHNGARIEAIRERIADLALETDLEAVLLVSLMEAADRVDSTTGIQMAYLKGWAPRSFQDLELRLPVMLPGTGAALQMEAVDAAAAIEADLIYLDPPYNQHSYRGNYHVWETLVLWDQPEVYGVACKRLDCRDYHSAFNSRVRILPALREVVMACRCRYLLVSFNNEGYVTRGEMEALLGERGAVTTLEHDHKRYVGAQIGIYNPAGLKVGQVGHLRNKEFLYLVECDRGD